MRCIRKYNIDKEENTYHLYIHTGNVKTYLFVKLSSKGKLVSFKEIKPIDQITKSKKQSWNTLFPEIKKYQFNKVFPRGTSRKEELLFLYKPEKAEQIMRYEHWLRNQNYIPEEIAWKIYSQIGQFKKIQIISKTKDRIIAKLDNRCMVSINLNCNKYYIYHNENDKYNKAIKKISQEMNIPIKFAAITRFLNKEDAYNVLKRMISLSSSETIMNYLQAYEKYISEKKETQMCIEEKAIKKFLKKEFSSEIYPKLELTRENLFSWANYLNNK